MMPDYGLRLAESGYDRSVEMNFYAVPLDHFSVTNTGGVTTFMCIPVEGKDHACTFDFGEDIIESLIRCLPRTTAIVLSNLIEAPDSVGSTYELPEVATVDLVCRLGSPTEGTNESFIPLEVTSLSPAGTTSKSVDDSSAASETAAPNHDTPAYYVLTRDAACGWHTPWVKQRAAIAFIRNELGSLMVDEQLEARIASMLDDFESDDIDFIVTEDELLGLARAAQRSGDPEGPGHMLAKLNEMRHMYDDRFRRFHELVQETRSADDDSTIGMLLTALGADALNAHVELVDALDEFSKTFCADG